MAVTLSTFGNYTVGTTPVENKGFVVIDSTTAQEVTLPVGQPIGYKFDVVRDGAQAVNFVAGSGETLAGADLLATDGAKIQFLKTTATEWQGYEDATFS